SPRRSLRGASAPPAPQGRHTHSTKHVSERPGVHRWVLVSFARHGRCKPQSFPRKRESTRQTFGNALSTGWIPPAERDGNDRRFERHPIPNDTNTPPLAFCRLQGLYLTWRTRLVGESPLFC